MNISKIKQTKRLFYKKRANKLLNVMKIVTFLTFFFSFQLIAVSSYSQSTRLSLNMESSKIKDVLTQIESQSEFYFLYNGKLVDVDKTVSINAENQTITDILSELFDNKEVAVKIIDRQIVLLPASMDADFNVIASYQGITITGTVTDANGEPLPGVSIKIKGTTLGTATDAGGAYSLQVQDENAILVFSYIGYISQEMTVGSRRSVHVTLTEDIRQIEEVVVVGYGVQKKINLTGAVNVVKEEQLVNRPASSISQLMKGIVPGLSITYNNTGGDPDAVLNWQIRGQGSPYILIDGVPMSVNAINPNDIESVTVLKDAASAAIYGARAAYGVVLITTKAGKRNTDKIDITYSNNLAWSRPTTLPQPMNSLEYANYWNAAAANSGTGRIFSDEVIERIKAYMANPNNTPSSYPDPTAPNKWGKMNYANANTNWFDVFFKDWVYTQRHNIDINGGSERSSYYASAGVYTDNGHMEYGDDKFKRFYFTSNITTDINKWFKINFLSKFTRTESDWPQDGYGGNGLGRSVLFHDIIRRWPTDPVKTPDGQWSEMSRIAIYESGARDKYTENNLWLTLNAVLEPVKNWFINGSYTFNTKGYDRLIHQPVVYLNDINGIPFVHFDVVPPSQVYKGFSNDHYQKFDIYSTYQKIINAHSFSIMIGHNREMGRDNGIQAYKQELITDSSPSFSTAIGRMVNSDNESSWATMGYFSRITYNYKEKYLLELNGRYDGSYKYRKEDRWGFFPSVSAGYRISEESFWENLKSYVPYLKIRASYGSLGDQNGLAYNYLSTMAIASELTWIGNDGRVPTVYMPGIVSESLTWETLTTKNLGIDASFFKNRLNASFDIFRKDRKDIVTTGKPLPSTLGTSAPQVNGNAMKTNGWELSLNWMDKINDVQYGLGFALSDYISTITKVDNPTNILSSDYIGKRVGEIWGYEVEGLFQSEQEIASAPSQSSIYGAWFPGDVRYKDLNGDGVINVGANTLDNPGDRKVIGNSLPRFMYDINLYLSWKSFDFSMMWTGIGKSHTWFASGDNAFWGIIWGGDVWSSSCLKPHLDYWRPDNTDAYFPRVDYTSKNRETSSRYLQNIAYLRLRNLQLGYQLPSSLLQKIAVKNAKIYLSGENLFTFDHLSSTFDPEALRGEYGPGKILPLNKSLSLGITVTF